jgi:hypothetical protein
LRYGAPHWAEIRRVVQVSAEDLRCVSDIRLGVEDVVMPDDINLAAGRAWRQRDVFVFALKKQPLFVLRFGCDGALRSPGLAAPRLGRVNFCLSVVKSIRSM